MASKKWKNLQKGLPMSKQVTIVDKDSDRRVTILRDSTTAYPEIWMEVFIGPGSRSETAPSAEYFAKARRAEERRVGKGCGSTWSTGRAACHYIKKKDKETQTT